MALTKEQRVARRIERDEREQRMAAARQEARTALDTNTCPDCGAGVHSNLAISGWVQCDRSGSGHFRRDPSGEACNWQGFWR